MNKKYKQKKYYNIIERKSTTFAYRFKTKEEFENQYGENWRYRLYFRWGLNSGMDELFGKNLETRHTNITIYKRICYMNKWWISYFMLVKNQLCGFNTFYKNKKLIYE